MMSVPRSKETSMKKFAIGCGVVLLLVVLVVGIGGYVAYTRYVKPMTGAITEFAQLADIEKQVKNTSSFAAPDTGELTEEMLNRFVKVQEAMQARLGTKMDELKAKYDQLDKAVKSERRQASFTEAMGALKDLSTIMVEAKHAQVEALNQASFSVREYEWVRKQVYAAVGIVAAGFDVKNIQKMAQEAGRQGEARAEAELGDVPERNKELVKPYEKKLQEWAPLAYFGL
jgi:hypothetical protein